jgi:hypothetical protein
VRGLPAGYQQLEEEELNSRVFATAVLATAAVLAGCSSTPAAPAHKSGTETIVGSATGAAANAKHLTLPLQFGGVVATTAMITLTGSGGGGTQVFVTPAGRLSVTHSADKTQKQSINAKTCAAAFTAGGTFHWNPKTSTKDFADATGSGTFTITFGGVLPRLKDHKCNESQNANPSNATAYVTFRASGKMTVK